MRSLQTDIQGMTAGANVLLNAVLARASIRATERA
jgi:hypothetical protein